MCNAVGVGWGGVDYVLHGVECCSSVEYCMCVWIVIGVETVQGP